MPSYCSVIIPCKNREKILSRAVESALSINIVNEVIVIDDSSSQQITSRIFEHLGSSEKIRIFPNTKYPGAQGARVAGAEMAKNDIIFFLDSDDILAETGVRLLFSNLDFSSDIALVYGNVTWNNSKSDFYRVEGYAFNDILRNLCLCPFSGLGVKKSLVPWHALELALPSWQDDDFVLTISQRQKVKFVDTISASMFGSGDSISVSKYRQYRGLSLLLKKWKPEILKQFGWRRLFLWRIRQLILIMFSIAQLLEQKKVSRESHKRVIRLVELAALRAGNFLLRRIRCHFDRIYA